MAEVYDILDGPDGDLAFAGGDLAWGESTLQHQNDLLVAVPGEYKQYPFVGVGLTRSLLDEESPAALKRRIQRELERDGQRVSRLQVTGRYSIELEASYA